MRIFRKSTFFQDNVPLVVIHTTNSARNFRLEQRYQREFFKLTWIQRGKGHVIVGDRKMPIQENTLFLVHPKTPTTYDIKKRELELVNVLFELPLIQAEAQALARQDTFFQIFSPSPWQGDPAPYVQVGTPSCAQLIGELEEEQKTQERHFLLHMKYTVLQLLILMSREASTMVESRTDNDVIARANHLISHGFRQQIEVKNMAEQLGVTPNYLCRLYREKTGMTILESIRKKRLDCVAEKLRTTMLTTSEIAGQSGFNDLSHFHRLFKQSYKLTPGQYRKQFLN